MACKATFAIVTADGSIVQASTAFGIDGTEIYLTFVKKCGRGRVAKLGAF